MQKLCLLMAAAAVLCLAVAPTAMFAAEASGTVTSVAEGNLQLDGDASVAYAITEETEIVGVADAQSLVGLTVVVTYDGDANPPVASRVEVTKQ